MADWAKLYEFNLDPDVLMDKWTDGPTNGISFYRYASCGNEP